MCLSSSQSDPSVKSPSSLQTIYHLLYAAFGPQHWWPADSPWEVIVGAILTQNTNWRNVERAIEHLRQNRLLSIAALKRVSRHHLALCIRPAGYHNQKADRLLAMAKWLSARGGIAGLRRTPTAKLRSQLLSCPGIGPETADSILLYALNRPVFVVDAYTRRILRRLGLARGNESYSEIQSWFHQNLPRSSRLYNEYHALLVRLAKTHCRTNPICPNCPLERICPSSPQNTAVIPVLPSSPASL